MTCGIVKGLLAAVLYALLQGHALAQAGSMSTEDWSDLSGEELFELGYAHFSGDGPEKEQALALELFKKAIEKGIFKAHYPVGMFYHYGYGGVEVDHKKAAEHYAIAAELGIGAAQINYGWLFSHGEGVPHDNGETFKWYQKAAEQGVPQGQYLFGLLFANGQGTERDLEAAAHWLELAANRRHPYARAVLAQLKAMNPEYEQTLGGQYPLPQGY